MSFTPTGFLKANLYTSDEQAVRNLVHIFIYKRNPPSLNQTRIIKRTKLTKIPKEPVTERVIINAVGEYEQYGIQVEGSTLNAQVNSLLQDVSEDYHEQLDHFFSKVIIGNLPRDPSWLINQRDLDHLSATLFILHMIGYGIGERVNWNQVIRESQDPYRTRFGRTIPRPDSALLEISPEFIEHAKDEIKIVGFEPMTKLCIALSRKNQVQRLGRETIAQILEIPKNTARYRTSVFDLTLRERYLPNISSLGLRHRWVPLNIEPTDLMGSRHISSGVIMRIRTYEESLPVIFLQLEPKYSIGPKKSPGISTFTTDFESISFRLDRFDTENRRWLFDFWVDPERFRNKPHIWNPRRKEWLRRISDVESKIDSNVTGNQASLIFSLVANQGAPLFRRRLIELMGIKKTSIKGRIDRLLDIGAIQLLYHPMLEFSNLPDGVVLQIPDISGIHREKLMTWLNGAIPYVHLYWGKEDSLIAILRVPKGQGGMTVAVIREFLDEGILDIGNAEYVISTISELTTYYLSLPIRLHDNRKNQWRDPWIHS